MLSPGSTVPSDKVYEDIKKKVITFGTEDMLDFSGMIDNTVASLFEACDERCLAEKERHKTKQNEHRLDDDE